MDPVLSNTALGISAAVIVISFAAVGSALGCGTAACAAVGAWKRNYVQGRPASMMLLTFVGAPLSQTIYAMIMMTMLKGRITDPEEFPIRICIGIFGGLAQMFSAIYQGKAGAGGCVAYAESNQGFANYLMVLGIVETCAIFALVFSLMALPEAKAVADAAAAAVPAVK